MPVEKPKSLAELRSFGILMSFVFTLILGVSVYRKGEVLPAHLVLIALVSYFLLSALLVPSSLRKVEALWMQFAERLSVVMTFVIMTLTFMLMVTPVGLLLRLFRKDILQLRLEPDRKSYFEPIDPTGSGSRHYLPY